MSKLLKIEAALLSLVTSCAFAQTMFEQPTTSAAKPTTSMSASEFKNAVNNMSQQTNSGLNQQAKQLLPPTPTDNKNTAATPGSPQPATPSVDNSFSVNNNPTTTPAATTPSATGTPAPGAPTAPAQSDTYTGFGGSKSAPSKPSAPASSGSSGGWNINY